jgi:anti-sigma B factor antagonist
VEFELHQEAAGLHDILTPRGELDIATHTTLREHMVELLSRGRNNLVIDLSETSFIDSTALGSLIGARKNALARGGTFAVICNDPRIVKLLDITRLSEVLTRFDTREAWRASLASGSFPGA